MNQITVNSLLEDVQATNEIKRYRRSIGSTQKPRNPYSWWQACLVLFTYTDDEGITLAEAKQLLEETTGMEYSLFFANHITDAIDGMAPDPVKRQFTRSLPGLVRSTGLKYRQGTAPHGRPPFLFFYRDPKKARNILLTTFPELMPLFVELDRVTR